MIPANSKAPMVAPVEASMKNTPAIKQKELSMTNSTQESAIRAITVPFHGARLHVVEQDGQPYTPMKPIIEGMGLTWHGQHAKIKANASRWGILELRIPSGGGLQAMLCTPLRKLPGFLTTIEPGKVKNLEARAKIISYQNECDDALWQYWNDGIAVNPHAAPNMAHALEAANAVAAQVQAAVFEALLSGDKRWKNERWMLSFNAGRDDTVTPHASQIESDAVVMSLAYLAKAIAEPGGMLPSNSELANLAAACNKRLAQRIEFADSRKTLSNN